jgi:hypothetical protein
MACTFDLLAAVTIAASGRHVGIGRRR